MRALLLNANDSQYLAVGAASATFTNAMVEGECYVLTSTVACWIAAGSAPTAQVTTSGSTLIAANFPYEIMCPMGTGNKLAIIRDGATSGEATLTRAVK